MSTNHRTDQYQKLSCREGGQFDCKHHIVSFGVDGAIIIERRPTTGWTVVSRERHIAGISRSARIRAKA